MDALPAHHRGNNDVDRPCSQQEWDRTHDDVVVGRTRLGGTVVGMCAAGCASGTPSSRPYRRLPSPVTVRSSLPPGTHTSCRSSGLRPHAHGGRLVAVAQHHLPCCAIPRIHAAMIRPSFSKTACRRNSVATAVSAVRHAALLFAIRSVSRETHLFPRSSGVAPRVTKMPAPFLPAAGVDLMSPVEPERDSNVTGHSGYDHCLRAGSSANASPCARLFTLVLSCEGTGCRSRLTRAHLPGNLVLARMRRAEPLDADRGTQS
jgi:hypothetical protein